MLTHVLVCLRHHMAMDSIPGPVTNKEKWDKRVRREQDMENRLQGPQPHNLYVPLAGLQPSGVEGKQLD